MSDGNSTTLNFTRLQRFLYMGLEGNRYFPGKRHFSLESAHSIHMLIQEGRGVDVIKEVVKFSKEGKSLCPDALAYALAFCAHSKNERTKRAAYSALQEVCSSPGALFAFTRYLEEVSKPSTGWGRAHRSAVHNWYCSKKPKELATQVTKVVSKHRWTHLDLLRLAHVKPPNKGVAVVFKYITKGYEATLKAFENESNDPEIQEVLNYLKGVHEVKHTTDEQSAARLIEIHDLCFEHIPTPFLKSKEIWMCLIPRLPLQILLQQLPRLAKLGYLKHNSAVLKPLLERLRSDSVATECRLNPVETFVLYKQCELVSNKAGKTPIRHHRSQLDDALSSLHLGSFKMVSTTGKRYLVAVDVRNPMVHGSVVGCNILSPADATAIMLMSLVRAENNNVTALAFSMKGMVNIEVNNKMTFADISKRMRETPMGPVNVAAPLLWAQENKRPFDLVLMCTDNQTQVLDIHPADALKEYRKNVNVPHARFVICAMCSKGFSLAPPDEPGMLDIAGFDTNVLRVIQDFAQGVF